MDATNSTETVVVQRSRNAHRLALIAGLFVVVLLGVMIAEPMRPCGTLAAGNNPVLAFELARNVADLQAVFGTGGPCRDTLMASMEKSLWIDTLFFIPAYSAFLAFLFLGWRGHVSRVARIGVYATLLAALFDYAENLCLMKIMSQLDAPSLWTALLPWTAGVKWVALGLVAGLAGFILLRTSQSSWRIPAALIGVLALGLSIAAMVQPASFGRWMNDAIGASWLVCLIAVASFAFKRGMSPSR